MASCHDFHLVPLADFTKSHLLCVRNGSAQGYCNWLCVLAQRTGTQQRRRVGLSPCCAPWFWKCRLKLPPCTLGLSLLGQEELGKAGPGGCIPPGAPTCPEGLLPSNTHTASRNKELGSRSVQFDFENAAGHVSESMG